MTKANDLRQKDAAGVEAAVKSLQQAQFGRRMQKATQQLHNTATLRSTRRDIARAKTTYGVIGVKVWVYKGDTLGRNDLPSLDSTPRPEGEERRGPLGPRRDGDRRGGPGGDRRGGPGGPGGGRGGPRTGVSAGAGNVAPADGSDKPQEATAGAPEAPKSTVKRVPRKTAGAAPAGTPPTDGKGE